MIFAKNTRVAPCRFVWQGAALFLILFFLQPATMWAQRRIPKELSLGVIGGAVMSQMNFDASTTMPQDMAKGYTCGVSARYIEEYHFGLQVEALLTRRGYQDRFDEEYGDMSFKRSLTYLEVPVLSHIYFPFGKRDRSEISVNLGPKFGVMLWDKTDSNLPDDFGQAGSATYGLQDAHHTMAVSNRFDYGIQAGLGYEFRFSPKVSLQLEGRYYFGLGNIFPDEKSDVFETSSNQHVMVVMTLFWHKRLGKKKIVSELK
jgi:hypothetical protein